MGDKVAANGIGFAGGGLDAEGLQRSNIFCLHERESYSL